MTPAPTLALPRAAWLAVIRWTVLVVGASVLVSMVASAIILDVLAGGINGAGLFAAAILPVLLGGPAMFYLSLSRQRLRHANAQLEVLAATDYLTGCLNRRAFTIGVGQRLAPSPGDAPLRGALLVIDADHFKVVNDRFGHEAGDDVLRLMADAIRQSVRGGDLVGRLGGEEFGVFLGDADAPTAEDVAERIRWSIAALDFAPGGETHALSVSIGGAVFEGVVPFSQLFRLADARLYAIKHSGRNRIDLATAAVAARAAA